MSILVNKKIKKLFYEIVGSILLFLGVECALVMWFMKEIGSEAMKMSTKNVMIGILLCTLSMLCFITFFCYRYFKDQNNMLEEASQHITKYIAGQEDARIACNEEGELYHLFHEINTLVSILNAHTKKEARAKDFLKDTIADISHQLKTPLAALNIYNGIMQESSNDPETIEKFTNLSEEELDRIETLVQNLLKITKLDAGTLIFDKKPENVAKMLKSVGKHFAVRCGMEEKELVVTAEDNVQLLCDKTWIMEALDNLVKNALDHTGKGNKIEILCRRLPSVVQISIKDNGAGIHPEDIHFIFKRFYRSRFSKDTQGVGLGLPLVKAIVEAHNGSIEVDSELGKGSCFTINFLMDF